MSRRHNLLADEPGLGKTVQAIELINQLTLHRVLIIVKASIKRHWQRKAHEWLTKPRVIQVIDHRTDTVEELAEIIIVNYELVTHSFIFYQLQARSWDLLICDEAHYLKNKDAHRTVAVLAKNGLAHRASRSLMLTGTPILNRPIELYPMLKTFAPNVLGPYNDYWRYAKRYCGAWQDGLTFNVKGATNTKELNEKLRKHYMVRRLTHEVEFQLPKKRYEMVFIDSDEKTKEKLRVLEAANAKDFKHQKLDGENLATLRRETAEEKVKKTIDLIKEYVEGVDKIVIFAYHHSVIAHLEKELQQYGVKTLTGATAQMERQKRIDDFKTNKQNKIFLGQIQAAGEGIDGLQDVCNNALFIECSWVPGEIEQACKRIHRIGQSKPCLFRFLIWADSVEEHMLRVALDKVQIIREVLK